MRYDKIQFLYNCYLTLFVNNDRIVGDAGDALRGPPYPGKEPDPKRIRAYFARKEPEMAQFHSGDGGGTF